MLKSVILIALGASLLLTGCGIKGPLYMPSPEEQTEAYGNYPDDECNSAEALKSQEEESASPQFVRGPADDGNVYYNPLYSL